MLEVLPPELAITVCSHLPLQTLGILSCVSKTWHIFITENESTLYRNAALLHHFVPDSSVTLEMALREHHGDLWLDVQSWKEFCRRRFQLEKNWTGRGRSVLRDLVDDRKDIHRIKVDEKHRFIITTHNNGGLVVSNIYPTYTLFSISIAYVRAHAHCEYDNGFVIFDRMGHSMEVWRLICDAPGNDFATDAPPDDRQMSHDAQPFRQHPSDVDNRGHFRPWALIPFPERTRAFRFVYPTLVTAGEENIYLHDVRTGELIRVFKLASNTVQDWSPVRNRVTYLDLSAQYVFLAAEEWLRVFSRTDGSVLLNLPKSDLSSYHHITVAPEEATVPRPLSSNAVLEVQSLKHDQGSHDGISDFLAMHVSEDGKDMVILRDADVTFLQDWQRISRGEATFSDIAVVFTHQNTEFIYLAVGHGKVAVAHAWGIFVFTTDPSYHGITTGHDNSQRVVADAISPSRSFPRLSLCTVQPLQDHNFLSSLSCLQVTENRVYFTWDARDLPAGFELYKLEYVDDNGVTVSGQRPDPLSGLFPDHYWPTVGCVDLTLMPETS